MDFETLEDFIAITREGTFLEAAFSRDTTQSTLSKHIAKLEEELGLPLFRKQGRASVLTEEGKRFLPYAEKLVALKKDAVESLRKGKRLRIGTLPVLSQYHLLERLNAFSRETGTELRIVEAEETELETSPDDFDLILAREDILDAGMYEYKLLQDDVLAAVMEEGHRLSDRGSLTLEDLSPEPLLLMKSYTAVHKKAVRCFREKGLGMDIALSGRLESILALASQGNGIALLPLSSYSIFHAPGTVAIPVPEVPLSIGVLHRRSRPMNAEETGLVKFLK